MNSYHYLDGFIYVSIVNTSFSHLQPPVLSIEPITLRSWLEWHLTLQSTHICYPLHTRDPGVQDFLKLCLAFLEGMEE